MKITKKTNIQAIDFVNREPGQNPVEKTTRGDVIFGLVGTLMVGAGSAACFVGNVNLAIKIFAATIVFGLLAMAITKKIK